MKNLISRILLFAMVLYLCLPIANYVYAKENVNVIINDVCIDENAYIETIGEKLYVSARSVANPMGLNLEWNDVKKTLRISYKDKIISLIVASNLAIVDNSPIETEQPLKIVSDRAIIDLGFLCDILEATMTFNEAENAYCITIDVPKDFQPDVIKQNKNSNEVYLFESATPEMTKVKEVADALGLETIWDDSIKTLTLSSKLGDTLTLIVGDSTAWFNGDKIECSAPLQIINDESYIEYDFVEKLFTIEVPQSYTPVRQIADELEISVEWIDESKTVEFVDKNGDRLCMSVGSSYYTLNDKFYSNCAPLILKNGVAQTDQAVVNDAFSKPANDEDVELFASDKEFSGQLIFEKKLSSATYINVTVISVQSIVYSNTYGITYSDYDTQRVKVPANTRSVDFSVTKTDCTSDDRYIIGYSFLNSNDYYYDTGYLSYNGGIVTYLSSYLYNYMEFYKYSSTSDIIIKPKTYSYVTLDDAVFSGVIKTNNEVKFGADSSLNVSVRSATYYGESIISSVTLYPGNTSSANFSINVKNNSSTRNTSLYLRYDLYDGDDSIINKGYYKSPTASVTNRSQAKIWSISNDILSDINFVVLAKTKKTIGGTFYMPNNKLVEDNKEIIFDIDVQTVQSSVYSQKSYYSYASFENVASIKSGESYANYSLSVVLEDDETYIFKYKVATPYQGILPCGYSTHSYYTTNPEYATLYTADSDLSAVDFCLQESSSQYTYINNMPYNDDGIIYSSSDKTDRGSYFAGYYIYLKKGQTVTIELRSSDFDSYLYLLDDGMSVIASDDDGLGNRNSRISKWIGTSGYYYIQATSYHTGTTGKFALKIDTDSPLSGGATFTDASYNTITSIGDNSIIKANYKIKNTKTNPQSIRLFMVLYDNNGVLIDVKTKDITVTGISDTESLTMDLSNVKNASRIKSFIWTDNLIAVGNADYLYK